MDYRKLDIDTWNNLLKTGDLVTGYKSLWLALNDDEESNLHIFKDISGQHHFAIESIDVVKTDIEDPNVNGLKIGLYSYKFENDRISQFIDLTCNLESYLEEFTEIVKEITRCILENGDRSLSAVNQIISNWISFWANKRDEILSEENQIGLICELIVLNNLCTINPQNALKTWKGPLGEKQDFNFTDWTLEVKGTRKLKRTHIVNGLDQLKPIAKKNLAFISFQITESTNDNSINLPGLIDTVIKFHFKNKPALIIRFNELLACVGYNPVHAEEYRRFNVEILESTIYTVNDSFPKLTSDMLKEPINTNVSSVWYHISLEGVEGKNLNDINWGDYFY